MNAPATRRGGRILIGTVLTIAAEAALFQQFQQHDPRSGWFTHFFIGTAVALVGMTVREIEEHRPVRLPGVWLVAGHLLAMLPDVFFRLGLAHQHWMDAFLGHLISHSVPGGDLAWYPVFLVALAVHLAVDVRVRSGQVATGRRRA